MVLKVVLILQAAILKSVQFDQVVQYIRCRSCCIELSEDEDFVLDYVMNIDFMA